MGSAALPILGVPWLLPLPVCGCEPGTGHPVPPPLSSRPSGPWPGRHPKPRHSLGPCGRTGTWRHGASSHFLPKEQGQSGNFHPKETRVPLLRVLLPRPEGVSEVVVVLPQAAAPGPSCSAMGEGGEEKAGRCPRFGGLGDTPTPNETSTRPASRLSTPLREGIRGESANSERQRVPAKAEAPTGERECGAL